MKRLTFCLCSVGVKDGSCRQKGQNKPKRAIMSAERHLCDLSVQSMLLGTLIERHMCETPSAMTVLKTFEAVTSSFDCL